MSEKPRFTMHVQGNLIAGLLAITPLIVVWFVFDFLLTTLSQWGHPLAIELTAFLKVHYPPATPWLANPTIQWFFAVLVSLLVLYGIGAFASAVFGRRLIDIVESVIHRIPIVQSIYSAAKKLIGVLQQKPEGGSRVVLLEFPHPGLRAIGFLTRTFTDATTGQELAAVYVPTAPNPTSGYLEIVPLTSVAQTDMTMDQAMAMILSGGATTPDKIRIGK